MLSFDLETAFKCGVVAGLRDSGFLRWAFFCRVDCFATTAAGDFDGVGKLMANLERCHVAPSEMV